jgi:hypothetical protein
MNLLIRWIAIFGASLLLAPSAAAVTEVSAAFEQRRSFASPEAGDPRSPNAIEMLEGNEALRHLRNLKAKRPDASARAGRILRERGYQPTNEVMVMRSTALARSNGEVTFWLRDDGVDRTWGRSIYMIDYANGVEGVADAQIFVDTRTRPHRARCPVRVSCRIGDGVSRLLAEA